MAGIREKLQAQRLPIGAKLVVLFLAVTLCSLGATTILTRLLVKDDQLAMVRDSQTARVKNTANMLDEYLQGLLDETRAIAAIPAVSEFAAGNRDDDHRDAVRTILAALQKKDAYHEGMSFLDVSGSSIVSGTPSEEGTKVPFGPDYQRAVVGTAAISDVSMSTETGQPAFWVSAPVLSANNRVIGVLRSRISLAVIVDRITAEAATFGAGTATMLVDDKGLRLALSDPKLNVPFPQGGLLLSAYKDVGEDVRRRMAQDKRWGNTPIADSVTGDPQPELAAVVDGGAAGSRQASIGGADREVSFASLSVKPWKLVATTPTSVITGATDSTLTRVTIIGLIAAVIAAVLAFLFARTITRPIVRLARVTDAVSMGQTDVTIEEGANDEIGDLAASIRRMVASVKYYMAKAAQDKEAA